MFVSLRQSPRQVRRRERQKGRGRSVQKSGRVRAIPRQALDRNELHLWKSVGPYTLQNIPSIYKSRLIVIGQMFSYI